MYNLKENTNDEAIDKKLIISDVIIQECGKGINKYKCKKCFIEGCANCKYYFPHS
jgi:hypothetical protein